MIIKAYIQNYDSKEYLETDTPIKFTTSQSSAWSVELDTDKLVADQTEPIIKALTELIKYDFTMKISLSFVDDKGTMLGAIVISDSGLIKAIHPSTSSDIVDFLNNLANEIVGDVGATYIKGATSGMLSSLSKTVKDLDRTMGKGSGKLSIGDSTDIDEIIDAINNETKGHVSKPEVTLKDYVCGYTLSQELDEVKNFMENYQKYKDLNIELPIGILLKGAPGTGKTYAAKCIAGSTDCYFISCTASSLQGMYIGSGSQNIRELFNAAKMLQKASNKGVIIFIDEIDSLGSRDSHSGGAGGEEDRTVNQLLAEMNGFEDIDRIMVMAATNYAERLDDALTRSGRFSRQIYIPYPKESERQWLLDFYFSRLKTPLSGTDTYAITDLTDGLSPADIKEVANESAILAVRAGRTEIILDDVNEAINKCITKNIRNEDDPKSVGLVAIHECGHVLAEFLYLNEISTKVTNFSYGGAGGFTQSSFRLEGILDKDKFLGDIKTLLAGRAAEEVLGKTVTNGASNDLYKAKRILKTYYVDYMFDKYDSKDLDNIIINKINELYNNVVEDFNFPENYEKLDRLSKELQSKRILYKIDLINILNPGGIL